MVKLIRILLYQNKLMMFLHFFGLGKERISLHCIFPGMSHLPPMRASFDATNFLFCYFKQFPSHLESCECHLCQRVGTHMERKDAYQPISKVN
jgi:hypothetical protein